MLFVFLQLRALNLYVQDGINNRRSSAVVFRLTFNAKNFGSEHLGCS